MRARRRAGRSRRARSRRRRRHRRPAVARARQRRSPPQRRRAVRAPSPWTRASAACHAVDVEPLQVHARGDAARGQRQRLDRVERRRLGGAVGADRAPRRRGSRRGRRAPRRRSPRARSAPAARRRGRPAALRERAPRSSARHRGAVFQAGSHAQRQRRRRGLARAAPAGRSPRPTRLLVTLICGRPATKASVAR